MMVSLDIKSRGRFPVCIITELNDIPELDIIGSKNFGLHSYKEQCFCRTTSRREICP
jgi:hypothetical protein